MKKLVFIMGIVIVSICSYVAGKQSVVCHDWEHPECVRPKLTIDGQVELWYSSNACISEGGIIETPRWRLEIEEVNPDFSEIDCDAEKEEYGVNIQIQSEDVLVSSCYVVCGNQILREKEAK